MNPRGLPHTSHPVFSEHYIIALFCQSLDEHRRFLLLIVMRVPVALAPLFLAPVDVDEAYFNWNSPHRPIYA